MLYTIKSYSSFNFRRYSDPWAALVKADGKPDFTKPCATYTGGFRTGDAGDLAVADPKEGAVYMYGQKDNRGNNTERAYVQFVGGEFVPVEKRELVRVLNASAAAAAEAEIKKV